MKTRKLGILFLVLTMLLTFTACGSKSEEAEVETEETVVEETEEAEEETEEAEEPETEASAAEFTCNGWVDLENIQFAVNGKVYTVGKTTLKELIDDGVPFEEDDLKNAQNNVDANSSVTFHVTLGEYYTASISVGNFTDDGQVAETLPVCEVYLPVHDDEEQDILSFPFPLDLTLEELEATAGDPSEKSHYEDTEDPESDYYTDTYEYKNDSTKYYGSYGYNFEFLRGKLSYVTIDYLP